jgi:hypothetical protein
MSATSEPPSRTQRSGTRRSGARRAGDDAGLSLIEVAVSLGILGVVMAMVVPMVLTFNRLSVSTQWRSEANTSLRPLVDQVFAELRSARSLPTCAGGTTVPGGGTIPVQTAVIGAATVCLRPIDNGAQVIGEATGSRLCFVSQRRSMAIGTGPDSVLTAPAYTCVEVGGAGNDQFLVIAYPPSPDGYAVGTTQTSGAGATTQTLGTIQAGATPFAYFDAAGNATTTLTEIRTVEFRASLSRYDGVRTDTQAFEYRIALRAPTYQAGG